MGEADAVPTELDALPLFRSEVAHRGTSHALGGLDSGGSGAVGTGGGGLLEVVAVSHSAGGADGLVSRTGEALVGGAGLTLSARRVGSVAIRTGGHAAATEQEVASRTEGAGARRRTLLTVGTAGWMREALTLALGARRGEEASRTGGLAVERGASRGHLEVGGGAGLALLLGGPSARGALRGTRSAYAPV